MHIFEIIVPGDSLDYPSQTPRDRWDVQDVLSSLITQFFEANLALNLFERVVPEKYETPSMEAWMRRGERSREMERIVEEERGPSTDFFKEDIRLEADARLKREEWAAGQMPPELENRIRSLYAKAFLSALDGFDKLLRVLADNDKNPPLIAELHKKLVAAFPDLRGVRNSVQHHEKRVRSLDRNLKQLNLKPITNGMVPPELKVLASSNLHGSKFCTTMDNGHYGEIDVSPESMKVLQAILQEAIYAFDWTGPKRHLPGRKI